VTGELASAAGEAGGFTVSEDGTHWTYRGALTFDNAASVREAANALPLPRSGRVDLSRLDPADSAALTVLFALRRRAKSERHKIVFEGVPAGLAALARVYGVEELL
jgi:phospholipid transport system transporter-binding protein